MNIKDTYQAISDVVSASLPTFSFYGMYKSQYNTVKSITDNTIIIEPPRQWPVNYRNTCEVQFDANVWIGIRRPIKQATGAAFEYPPFYEIELRDTLHLAALTFVNALNNSEKIEVVGDFDGSGNLMTLYDPIEGQSTNIQAWGSFTLKLKSFGSVEIPPVFYVHTADSTLVTADNN